jgi:preprotein translocase subunit SecA
MMDAIKEEIAGYLFNVEVTVEETNNEVSAKGLEDHPANEQLQYSSPDESGAPRNEGISRNAPCPCGSGRKYKRCHGAA